MFSRRCDWTPAVRSAGLLLEAPGRRVLRPLLGRLPEASHGVQASERVTRLPGGTAGRGVEDTVSAASSDRVLDLIDRGHLAVDRAGLLALGTPPAGLPVDFDRVEGVLLGLAIGDALGNTSEGQSPGERREAHGEIRDYLPNRYADHRSVGLPSDDTQLAFWTLEHLLEDGQVVPDRLAELFAHRRIFGIGRTVRAFLAAFSAGQPWYLAAQRSAGNGALMRIAPVVVPHLLHPSSELWADAVLAGAVTHNDPSSIAACVSFAGLLGEALSLDEPPRPEWWLDRCSCMRFPASATPSSAARLRSWSVAGPVSGSCRSLVRTRDGERHRSAEPRDRWCSPAVRPASASKNRSRSRLGQRRLRDREEPRVE